MIGFFQRLVDLVAPRVCPVCGQRMTTQETVCCVKCWLDLPRTRFENNFFENETAQMFWGLMPVEKCYSMFRYQSHGKLSRIVEQFKYHDHPEYCLELGRVMAQTLKTTDFAADIDVVIPVPLTKKRFRNRGYNQSELLAKGFVEIIQKPLILDAIARQHFQQSQTRLGRVERQENTSGAFVLRKGEQVRGKRVLLIDDVITTGATLRACGEQLLAAGAKELNILTLAIAKV